MATEKLSATVYDRDGKESGHLELPEGIFNAPLNTAVLHQAVKRQQANDRQGTARSRAFSLSGTASTAEQRQADEDRREGHRDCARKRHRQ